MVGSRVHFRWVVLMTCLQKMMRLLMDHRDTEQGRYNRPLLVVLRMTQ